MAAFLNLNPKQFNLNSDKYLLIKKFLYFLYFIGGDPDGIRTRVTAVKGRCLNLLTTGPTTLFIIFIKKKMSRDFSIFLFYYTFLYFFYFYTKITQNPKSPFCGVFIISKA